MGFELRRYRQPSALQRRLDQFKLVGRKVARMEILDDCGSCKFYGTIREVERSMGKRPIPIRFETDGWLEFGFDDGSVFTMMARDNLAYEVEFTDRGDSTPLPPSGVTGAEIAFADVLGHAVSNVEVKAELTDKDSYGDWLDEDRHRKSSLVKWLVLKFDHSYSIKMGTWIDYSCLELEGPDGQTVLRSFAAARDAARRFRLQSASSHRLIFSHSMRR